jgi:peroxiredoxin
VAQVRQHQPDFDRYDTRVVVISFVGGKSLRFWHQQTGIPYPLLIDADRAVYRKFQLGSAFWRVWGLNVLWTYARLVFSGRRYRGIQGDPHQLGGDFLIDARGIVRLAHYSEDPTDRPAVATLLETIQALENA